MLTNCFPLQTFLSNDYLLLQTTPYLDPVEILALSLTSKVFHNLLFNTRGVFRRVDLSAPKPREEKSDSLCLRQNYIDILSKPFIHRDLQTLILDGLSFDFDLLSPILLDSKYRLSLLSIRECPINQPKLQQILHYLVRPGRCSQSSLKGVYMFGRIDGSPRPKNAWQRNPALELEDGWAETVQACEGEIAFDAILCQGSRHQVLSPLEDEEDLWNGSSSLSSLSSSPTSVSSGWSTQMSINSLSTSPTTTIMSDFGYDMTFFLPPKLAMVTLKQSCASCHAPKPICGAPTLLYAPPPIHSSLLKDATLPNSEQQEWHYRCGDCAKDRTCEDCGKWWCESCYDSDDARIRGISKAGVLLDCYDCGRTCIDCKEDTCTTCTLCRRAYCNRHTDGATDGKCDWCSASGGRLRRELY